MGSRRTALQRRADRALERQLAYQEMKAEKLKGMEPLVFERRTARSSYVREKLEAVRPIPDHARVLEVGCGAHGLIFFFGASRGVGVDPLADHYGRLFPGWQDRARTIAASGENLPLSDASFDVVLCDNVVDHAESPRRILREIARVLRPGGLFFFEVNVHHPFYHLASTVHAAWRALGIPFEVGPFADHTYHFTPRAAAGLFDGLPFRILTAEDDIAECKRRRGKARHPGDWLKRIFFKNARYEVVAVRD